MEDVQVQTSASSSKSLGAHNYPDDLKPQAHHIVPLNQMERRAMSQGSAQRALALLKKAGIDLGNAKQNGVWLPSKSGRDRSVPACVHRGTHTNAYLDAVADAIVSAMGGIQDPTPEQAEAVIDGLRQKMLNGELAPQRDCYL